MTVPFMRAYTRAARAHLPPARRARDRRHGGVHPDRASDAGGERDRARRRCARTRSASRATASTAPGSRTPTSSRSAPRSSTACSASGRTSSSGCARRSCPTRRRSSDPDTPGEITDARACAQNVSVGVRYLDVVAARRQARRRSDNLMEDAATAEISRSQIWQWVRHGAVDEQRVRDGDRARGSRRRGEGALRRGCASNGSRTS